MKASGAPETGDLVRLKKTNLYHRSVVTKNWWQSGLIIECRGIECRVLWNAGPQAHSWWPRSKLEVINESR